MGRSAQKENQYMPNQERGRTGALPRISCFLFFACGKYDGRSVRGHSNLAHKLFEARVRPQRIQARFRVEMDQPGIAVTMRLFEQSNGVVGLSQTDSNQRELVRREVLRRRRFL